MCDYLYGTNEVCLILDTFSLKEVAAPLCSITKTFCPIMSLWIFFDLPSDSGSFYFQSLLDQLWDARFSASWFDSEAVFLGSLVILGGFVAMGQRVKNIIECDIPSNHHTVWEKE